MENIKFRLRNKNNDIIAYEYIENNKWWYILMRSDGFKYEPKEGVCAIPGKREMFTGKYDICKDEIYENDTITCPPINGYVPGIVKFGVYREDEGSPYGWYVQFPSGIQAYLNSSWDNYAVIVNN
jgi:hypothetical protein